jgi:hypothetical protein
MDMYTWYAHSRPGWLHEKWGGGGGGEEKLTTFRPQDRTMVQKDAFKRSRDFWPKTDNF